MVNDTRLHQRKDRTVMRQFAALSVALWYFSE
jgi:hypothetical protein